MSDLEIIKKIEELVSQTSGEKIVLEQVEMLKWDTRGYIFDKQGNVIRISLFKCNLSIINDLVSLLSELKNLNELHLSYNQIVDVSPLKELKNLSIIYLTDNLIIDISPLKELKNLTEFYLSDNQIVDISSLKGLKKISVLYLWNNQIVDISPLKELKNLKTLYLINNQIVDISPLKVLKNLKTLYLTENQIVDISPIKDLLKKENFIFHFDGNPLEIPPLEIVQQGKAAIKQWFEQEEKYGRETVYEAKVLIVGEPGAGKTTLMKKLLDENTTIPASEKEVETLGVVVHRGFEISHPENQNIKITVNLWDFGGQEIQYFLHQYFLSSDALYVVVSDKREENTRFDYWFQMIEMLGTASSRIFVLMNRFKNSFGNKIFDRRQYRRDFPKIEIDDAELDLSETTDKWDNFKRKIAENLSKLPIVGQQNIKAWNKVRKHIEKIEKPYISVHEFYEISFAEGLSSEEHIQQMLQYFHKIGVVVYFAEDLRLAKTVFLSPNWITTAIYAVLHHQNDSGIFQRDWLFDFWKQRGYKKFECEDLLHLMLKYKFDICYSLQTDENQYIVPMLLNKDMPENAFDFSDMLQLRYSYENFMPFGLMNRLIVRLHSYIYEQTVWRRGAILIYENHTKAEIVEPYGKKEIQIRITGKQRKEFRAIIKSELDMIVKQYPYIPEIQVPCICSNCRNSPEPFFYPYIELIDRREFGEKIIKCGKRPYKNEVNVVELINGIEFTNFRRLLLDENFEEFFKLMKSKFAGISYQTKKEKLQEGDYQRELHIILKENGLDTEAEHATSDGRIDNIVRIGSNLYIFECKTSESAQEAINQIIKKEYALKFQYDFENIYIFGIKFSSKTRNIEEYKYQKIND